MRRILINCPRRGECLLLHVALSDESLAENTLPMLAAFRENDLVWSPALAARDDGVR